MRLFNLDLRDWEELFNSSAYNLILLSKLYQVIKSKLINQ